MERHGATGRLTGKVVVHVIQTFGNPCLMSAQTFEVSRCLHVQQAQQSQDCSACRHQNMLTALVALLPCICCTLWCCVNYLLHCVHSIFSSYVIFIFSLLFLPAGVSGGVLAGGSARRGGGFSGQWAGQRSNKCGERGGGRECKVLPSTGVKAENMHGT